VSNAVVRGYSDIASTNWQESRFAQRMLPEGLGIGMYLMKSIGDPKDTQSSEYKE